MTLKRFLLAVGMERWVAMTRKCKRCREEFQPRAAGRKQIFCSSKCRKTFEKQLRQWALIQVAKGKVDLETLALNKRS